MKLFYRNLKPCAPGPGREDGSATLVNIALLAIMMVLLASNVRTIVRLQRELKFVDQKQIHRLNISQTNMVNGAQPR